MAILGDPEPFEGEPKGRSRQFDLPVKYTLAPQARHTSLADAPEWPPEPKGNEERTHGMVRSGHGYVDRMYPRGDNDTASLSYTRPRQPMIHRTGPSGESKVPNPASSLGVVPTVHDLA